jgi:hypothetical protein
MSEKRKEKEEDKNNQIQRRGPFGSFSVFLVRHGDGSLGGVK